tara:strand:- start:808 stop:2205 length:1398 start_codon:yes stop_codon:yes gene_type:complete
MKIGQTIINELIKVKDVISVSIVGSYTEKSIEEIGDLDIVVICKKLSKKVFLNILKRVKNKKFKHNIIINSTFGPMKLSSNKSLPIHLMIYDTKSHIDHVLKSPFTCFDWERSKIFRGKSLKEIFPVKKLQLNDFSDSRRTSTDYLNDIKKGKISIRRYYFKNNKVFLKKKYVKIDSRNRGEFVYHIINFLVINLYKFIFQKNIKVDGKKFDKLFLKITKNNIKNLNQFKILKKNKENKKLVYKKNTINLAFDFLKDFNHYIHKIKKEYIELNFLRHAKTSLNQKNKFIGIRSNPKIISIPKKKQNNIRYDYIIISNSLRSEMTKDFFHSPKYLVNDLINEIDYGKADGLTLRETKNKFPYLFKKWQKKIDVKFPGGENSNDVKKRAIKFLKFLNRYKNGSKILIISHSFFLRVLISIILKINLYDAFKIKIDHLKIFQFLKKGRYIYSNINRIDQQNIFNQLYD